MLPILRLTKMRTGQQPFVPEAFKKEPNKSPYVIDDATHLPLDQYFTRQTTDWEGVFKSNDTGSSATNYNPVAMAKESKNNTLQRETRAIIDANYKILPASPIVVMYL